MPPQQMSQPNIYQDDNIEYIIVEENDNYDQEKEQVNQNHNIDMKKNNYFDKEKQQLNSQ